MIHLAIQKRSGKIFKIMKVISRACLISSAGKRLKELRMQLRITVLRLSFTKRESPLAIQKNLQNLEN
ncbi:Uncharacterised protein [Streptococcus pneumoniae]|nr:Uncharacterised protein [Streptococcus pneumoniae]